MKTRTLLFILAVFATGLAARADDKKLSPEPFDELDKHGYFSTDFKAAIHELVDINDKLVATQADEVKLKSSLPDLQRQADAADAKIADAQKTLEHYDQLAESDFTALDGVIKDAKSTVQDQLAAAQAYLWAYPSSPHTAEAQQDLQTVQKKIADQLQATRDAEAARLAEQQRLILGAQNKTLSLLDWRTFLHDMTEMDVVKYIGQPTSKGGDYWNYAGEWTVDPSTQLKAGLQVSFNGGRVLGVAPITH